MACCVLAVCLQVAAQALDRREDGLEATRQFSAKLRIAAKPIARAKRFAVAIETDTSPANSSMLSVAARNG
jgi:hypothetical protein